MNDREDRKGGTTRRKLLQTAAAAAPAAVLPLGGIASASEKPKRGPNSDRSVEGMNVVIFITDQERAIQHFPPGWARRNLPGLTRLRKNGVTFPNAFTNACMCSPARSTLMTGYFPAQHGVKYTLELDMDADEYPQVELSLDFANIASVMSAAGYNVIYKGKWHMNKPANGQTFVPEDVNQYGFQRWDPQDAGANQDISEAGGGTVNNDGRFMHDDGSAAAGEEGAIPYINSQAASDAPFCLIVSLVNPHDVLFYPRNATNAGYTEQSWFDGEIKLPKTVGEDLSTKPDVQREFLKIFNASGKLKNRDMKREYLNFYANLMKSSDEYLVEVLDALDANGLTDDTLVIRTSDHGEMGVAHGGLRQKNFNFYEEATNVPLVYSNPKLYKRRLSCKHLVSHADFLPTLASLFRVPKSAKRKWEGVNYARSVLNPRGTKAAQDYVVFTFDDYQSGQASGPYPKPPNHIVSIREKRWKLAKYYDPARKKRPEWEMYDLKHDPLERTNLGHRRYDRTPTQQTQFKRLKRKLARVQRKRLRPLPNTPEPETP